MIRELFQRLHLGSSRLKQKIPSNTFGWRDCRGIDTLEGYQELGRYNPGILSSAVELFQATDPDCNQISLSTHNGYLFIGYPNDYSGRYVAVAPIIEVKE